MRPGQLVESVCSAESKGQFFEGPVSAPVCCVFWHILPLCIKDATFLAMKPENSHIEGQLSSSIGIVSVRKTCYILIVPIKLLATSFKNSWKNCLE